MINAGGEAAPAPPIRRLNDATIAVDAVYMMAP